MLKLLLGVNLKQTKILVMAYVIRKNWAINSVNYN